MKVISAKKLSIGYRANRNSSEEILFENLNFELKQSELTCIIGANGVGKSTLIRTISGYQNRLKGDIYYKDKNISELKERDLSKLIGIVLTDSTNAGGLRVRELVELGRYPHIGFFAKISELDKQIMETAMKNVNIFHKANSFVSELSDGERQKAMIAKALAQECPILILDEPTAFLDIEGRIDIMNLLHKLANENQKTILISTHDTDLAFRLADKLWLLSVENGLETGNTEDIIISGKLDQFFKSKNIEFKADKIGFYPKQAFLSYAKITGNGLFKLCCENILARYSYQKSEDESKIDFMLNQTNDKKIKLESAKQTLVFDDFESLAEYLRS